MKDYNIQRIKHMAVWERPREYRYRWEDNEESLERNARDTIDHVCRYKECDKMCKSKGGLTAHQKRMHITSLQRIRFECGRRCVNLETE